MSEKTISELLDEQDKKKLKEQEKYNKTEEANDIKMMRLIEKQYFKAKETLGNRFIFKKQHERMYYFYFKDIGCIYISASGELNNDTIWKLVCYNPSSRYKIELSKIDNKNYKISELEKVLVTWGTIITNRLLREAG